MIPWLMTLVRSSLSVFTPVEVATMLLREAQQNKGHPLAKVRFAILVGGFVPRDAAIAASSKENASFLATKRSKKIHKGKRVYKLQFGRQGCKPAR